MAKKTFDGGKFLDECSVDIKLSTGVEMTVREVMPEVMAEISKMEEAAEQGADQLKAILGKICGVDASKFDGIGMVEAKGAVDFLLESLFDMKPQS
jgi:hypothetical protein